MVDLLLGFLAELRNAGIELSMGDALSAADAIQVLPLERRSYVFSALAATLVKEPQQMPLFRTVFEVYFGSPDEEDPLASPDLDEDDHGQVLSRTDAELLVADGGEFAPPDLELLTEEDLQALLLEALRTGNPFLLRDVAEISVQMYARVSEASHLNVAYFVHRTIRGLNLPAALARLDGRAAPAGSHDSGVPTTALDVRIGRQQIEANAKLLRTLIASEIRRALARSYGIRAVLDGLQGSLLDELDLVHASEEELAAMRRAVIPLSRLFATRMRRSHSLHNSGRLDFRRTIRKSLSSGGWLGDPQFRRKSPSRPALFLLADVSGSVAAFASFIFAFMFALSRSIPDVRVAVFVNRVDEVTDIVRTSSSLSEAVDKLSLASVDLHQGGDSDYGASFQEFIDGISGTLSSRTRLVIVGDARINQSAPKQELLEVLRRRAERVYWLNPEPREYWGTGDSAMHLYSGHCDGVFECRTLGQLREFVAHAR